MATHITVLYSLLPITMIIVALATSKIPTAMRKMVPPIIPPTSATELGVFVELVIVGVMAAVTDNGDEADTCVRLVAEPLYVHVVVV